MFIETLRADRIESPAERQRCLAIVHQELTRLDGLVGKLIELSKIESRPTAFERHPVRVSDFVGDALTAFEAMKIGGEAEAADVRADLDPDLLVYGDRSALAQAMSNLLSNAWKYTRPTGKKIEVRARADRETISISVSDNGVGIPRLEQAAIFEKFERGSGAVAGGAAGLGPGPGDRARGRRGASRAGRGSLAGRSRRALLYRASPLPGGRMTAETAADRWWSSSRTTPPSRRGWRST